MKTFLKVMLLLMLIGISIGLLLIGKGYDMYKEAIQETPLEEKVEEIKSKANYTKISELPQMYLDAVISV